LALESSALNGHTLKVILLEATDRPLDLDELRAEVAGRLGSQRRATQRIEIGPDGNARWVDDEAFDIAAQIDRYAGPLADGGPGPALWAIAASLMQRRLDHRRSLWHLDLVGPLADGHEAIVARIHHAMADGISAMRLLGSILWTSDPNGTLHPARTSDTTASSTAVTGYDDELRRLPGALRRELLGGGSHTPLDQRIGSARSLAFSFLPLEDLRRIGHGRQPAARVNDVLLAVVAGALNTWAPLARERRTRVRAQIPVSLHVRRDGGDAAGLGNLESFLNVDLPIDEADPLVRIDRVRDQTTQRKQLDDAEELYDFFHAVSRLPRLASSIERLASSPMEWSVSISNVPGPSSPVSVLGRRVERLGTIAEPADHHALRISAISSADTLAVGLCTDPTVLPDIDRLAAATDVAFSQLRDLVTR